MMKRPLTVSLVIPVYNEESHIAATLQSATAQRLPFLEIIVVDNNSTDDTAAIAGITRGVTVLHERRQGVVYARNTGFAKARGDIIARIDGDTVLPENWTQTLQMIFADPAVDAVSGRMHYYDMTATKLIDGIDLFFRRYFARVLGDEVAMQGANMAIRRRVWQAIATGTCADHGTHEDVDLSVHANRQGFGVRFDERLVAGIGLRRTESGFWSFCMYAWGSPKTYRMHGLKSARRMYPVAALAILSYLILKLLHRGYDPELHGFSAKLLLTPGAMRVNPATFLD